MILNSFYSSSAPNAGVSVDVDTFSQYYLVAMAMSLDKLGKKLQINHLHVMLFHMV